MKSKLFKERTNFKDVKISDVFPSFPAHGQQRRIFISLQAAASGRSEQSKTRWIASECLDS